MDVASGERYADMGPGIFGVTQIEVIAATVNPLRRLPFERRVPALRAAIARLAADPRLCPSTRRLLASTLHPLATREKLAAAGRAGGRPPTTGG